MGMFLINMGEACDITLSTNSKQKKLCNQANNLLTRQNDEPVWEVGSLLFIARNHKCDAQLKQDFEVGYTGPEIGLCNRFGDICYCHS